MKNLTFLASLLLMLFTSNLYAQDTIQYGTGDIILGKVIEITDNQIKYKKAVNPSGPIYSIEKREISVIKYANGETDRFLDNRQLRSEYKFFKPSFYEGEVPISKEKFENILKSNSSVYKKYKRGYNLRRATGIAIIPTTAVFLYAAIDYPWFQIGEKSDETLLVASGFAVVGAGLLYWLGDRQVNNSLDTYNNSISSLGLTFNVSENGIGFVLKF